MDEELLSAVAAHGLPGAPTVSTTPLEPSQWAQLSAQIARARLQGVLAAAVTSGSAATTDDQRSQALEAHAAAMSRALWLDQQLLEVIRLLREATLDVRVLKGTAVAHLDHADPASRNYGDLDLLIRADDFGDAFATLEPHGPGRFLPERRPGFDRKFAKEAATYLASGAEIDGHRTLAIGPYGLWIDLDDLWASHGAFSIGGVELFALDRECRLLHACYNALLGDPAPRLVALRDVATMALHPDLDLDRVLELAGRWRGQAVVAAALRTACRRLPISGLGGLGDWALRQEARRVDRILLLAYRSHGGSNSLELLSGVIGAGGVRDRLAYLHAMAYPSREYRAARRAKGQSNEWRVGSRELLHRGRATT